MGLFIENPLLNGSWSHSEKPKRDSLRAVHICGETDSRLVRSEDRQESCSCCSCHKIWKGDHRGEVGRGRRQPPFWVLNPRPSRELIGIPKVSLHMCGSGASERNWAVRRALVQGSSFFSVLLVRKATQVICQTQQIVKYIRCYLPMVKCLQRTHSVLVSTGYPGVCQQSKGHPVLVLASGWWWT